MANDYPQVRVKPSGFRIPATRSEWGALLLGLAAILHGFGRLLQGDTDVSVIAEISAGFGTLGLPSLIKQHSHIEVVSDEPLDMDRLHRAARDIAEGMRIGGPDDDTADLPTTKRPRPADEILAKRVEVRRGDES